MKNVVYALITGLLCVFLLTVFSCAMLQSSDEKDNSSGDESSSVFDINTLTEDDATLKIMTWNIYLGYGDGSAATAVVESYDPDIVQFQEAKGFYETFIDEFLLSHKEYSILNTEISEGLVSSTPILYKNQKFDVLDSGIVFLTDAYQANNSKTMSWAVFEEKASGKVFFDFDFHGAICKPSYDGYSHLSSQQANELAYEWRRKNVLQILVKREALSEVFGDAPTLITGDCNFNSSSTAYAELMDAGYDDAEVTAILSRTEDGLRTTHALGENNAQAGLTIDHVFGNGSVYFLTHYIDRGSSAVMASDHYPVIVTAYLE